jgi:hypothetical protein
LFIKPNLISPISQMPRLVRTSEHEPEVDADDCAGAVLVAVTGA